MHGPDSDEALVSEMCLGIKKGKTPRQDAAGRRIVPMGSQAALVAVVGHGSDSDEALVGEHVLGDQDGGGKMNL